VLRRVGGDMRQGLVMGAGALTSGASPLHAMQKGRGILLTWGTSDRIESARYWRQASLFTLARDLKP
jgi:hypothetical protein